MAVEITALINTQARGPIGPIGPAGAAGASSWDDITDKPTEFPPEDHDHAVSDITPVSSGKLIGRHAGGSGAAQEVGLDGGLEFQGANIRREALTGDVTASAGSNATTIANDAVTNAKAANMAEGTIKGRAIGGGTGDPQDLTAGQVQAIATTPAAVQTALAADPEGARAASGSAPDASERGVFAMPLDIPMPSEAIASTTHPSVVFVPNGWNGYRYWMVHTPWPNATFELPNICASHDGVTWEVPAGASNPLVTLAWVLGEGYGWAADTHMLLMADGRLGIYFIGIDPDSGSPAIQSVTWAIFSEDGRTWTAPVVVIAKGVDEVLASPCVILEADGTYTHFANKSQAGGIRGLRKRTSADGLTWSAGSDCTLPDHPALDPWHMDIKRVGSTYHMILTTYDDMTTAETAGYGVGRVYYLTSTDGLTWSGDGSRPAIPRLGGDFDDARHYRSAFWPVPGDPLRWDIWLSSVPTGATSESPPNWKIALLRNWSFDRDRKAVAETDFFRLMRQTQDCQMISTAWTVSVTGTGQNVAHGQSGLYLFTGATAASTAFARPNVGTTAFARPWQRAGVDRSAYYWNDRVRISWRFMWVERAAGASAYLLFGAAQTDTALPTLNYKLVAIKIVGAVLSLDLHDGTTLTNTGTIVTLGAAGTVEEIELEINGDGTVTLWRNRVEIGTYDGAPSGATPSTYYLTPAIYVTNGVSAANTGLVSSKLAITRVN